MSRGVRKARHRETETMVGHRTKAQFAKFLVQSSQNQGTSALDGRSVEGPRERLCPDHQIGRRPGGL